MKTPFRKADPLAEAQAVVDRLEAQRRPLAERLNVADARVESAQRARHEALLNGDPDEATTAKLDRACFEAVEARGGVEVALRAVVVQLDEATDARDRLLDVVARGRIAADAERRAGELEAAAGSLSTAARAFAGACAGMERALAEHGVRVDNPLCAGGSTPASFLARPIIMAAVRMAAPGVLPAVDGFGAQCDADPLLVVRRAQAGSGRLRDHADDVRDGRAPAIEMPRPSEAAAYNLSASPLTPEPMAIAVPERPGRTVTATWPDERDAGRRA